MSECGGGSSEGGVAVSDLQPRGGGGVGVASNHSSAESPPEMPLPSANVRKHRPTSAGPDTGCGYDLQFMSRSLPSVGAATASPVALPPPGSERPSMAAAAAPFCTTSTTTTFPAAADIFSSGVAPHPTLTTTTTTATTTMAALPTVTPPHTLQELLVTPQDYYTDSAAAAPAHAADASPRLRLRTPSPVSSTSSSPPSPPPPENRLTMAAVVAGLPVINHQYRSGSCGTSHLDLREASGTGDGGGVGYPHCSVVPASQADSVVADDDNLNHVFFTHEALSRQRNMLEEADARADLPFFASFVLVPWHSNSSGGGAGGGHGDAAAASEAMSSPPPPPSPSYSDSLSPRSGRAMASPLRCSPRGRAGSPYSGGGGGRGRSASPTRSGRGRLAGVEADEDADRIRIEDECFSSMLNMYRVALLWAWRAGSFTHPGVGVGGGGGGSTATRAAGGGGRPSPCPPPDALDAPPYGSAGFASPPPVSGHHPHHHHHPHHPSSSSSAAAAPRSVAFASSGDAGARSVSTPARGRSRSRSPGGYSEGGYSFSFYSESPVRPKSSCGASVAGTCPVVKPCPSPKEVNHRGSLYMSTGGGEGVWVRRYFALINGVLYCGRSNIDPAPKVLLRSAALMAVESDDRLKSANAAGAMSAPPGGAQRSHGFLVLLPPAAERFARQAGDGAAQHQVRSPSPGGASAVSTAASAYTRVIRFSAPTASSRAAWVAALRDGMVDPSPFLSTSPPRFSGAVGGGGS